MIALLVIAILVFLIVVHEFGHFIVAKLFRLRVEEFGIGYPPRAFILGFTGGTLYTLNWIPFGGFVRLFGDDTSSIEASSNKKDRFRDAPRGVQMAILASGVLCNVLIAWVLLSSALVLGIPRQVSSTEGVVSARLVISSVMDASPAALAGLRSGDTILSLESGDSRIESELLPQIVSDFISARGGKEVTVAYMRGNVGGEVVVRPAHAVLQQESGRVAIGVALALVTDEALSIPNAMKESVYRTFAMGKAVIKGLGSIVAGAFKGEPTFKDLIGPIGLVGAVSEVMEHGIGNVLAFAAFISVNLAVINLIPIPALDGGRMVLVVCEALMGRRMPNRVLAVANIGGILLVAFLLIVVTYQDIVRLLM